MKISCSLNTLGILTIKIHNVKAHGISVIKHLKVYCEPSDFVHEPTVCFSFLYPATATKREFVRYSLVYLRLLQHHIRIHLSTERGLDFVPFLTLKFL